MSEEHQLPSDSDEDDEDYVPDGVDSEVVSEAESEGEAESGPDDENVENRKENKKKRGRKRSKIQKKAQQHKKRITRKLKNINKLGNEKEEEKIQEEEEKRELTEEEERKRADSLWADFMKDTATIPKLTSRKVTNGSQEKSLQIRPKVEEKIKITKVFEFAGEEVKIEQEVPVESTEARLSFSSAENSNKTETSALSIGRGQGRGIKRGGLSGISSILGQIGKKTKISTLEKSKLDWDNYKKEENIEEEITTYNKGKDGYLERQDFLQRADLRQFEIERQLRNSNRRSGR